MTYETITEENLNEVANGTEVRFNYGAMFGSERGWIVGRETTRWGSQLLAMTETGSIKGISGFSTVGIGVYLV